MLRRQRCLLRIFANYRPGSFLFTKFGNLEEYAFRKYVIYNVRKVISWPQPADLSKADFSILWVWSRTQLFMRNLNKLDLHPRWADQDSSLFCKTGFWLGPNYAVNVIDTINTVKRKSCKLQSALVLLSSRLFFSDRWIKKRLIGLTLFDCRQVCNTRETKQALQSLDFDFFRCASISWFQVVSQWVSESFMFFGFPVNQVKQVMQVMQVINDNQW